MFFFVCASGDVAPARSVPLLERKRWFHEYPWQLVLLPFARVRAPPRPKARKRERDECICGCVRIFALTCVVNRHGNRFSTSSSHVPHNAAGFVESGCITFFYRYPTCLEHKNNVIPRPCAIVSTDATCSGGRRHRGETLLVRRRLQQRTKQTFPFRLFPRCLFFTLFHHTICTAH